MVLMAALGAVGVIYGIEIGSNLLNKVAFGTMYGFTRRDGFLDGGQCRAGECFLAAVTGSAEMAQCA